MISVLEVKNFQAWKHATLEFCNGVNIIKGSSHSGKSSLIRVFDWIFSNRPITDEMRPWSDEKKKLEIVGSVEFDDESFMSRVKGKGFNGYNSSVGDLEALNRDIPTEMVELANMQDNLRRQDDGYFLLTESPGNVARILNRKSGLEDIDIISRAAKGVLAELQVELKKAEGNWEESKREFEKLDRLSALKPSFDKIANDIVEYQGVEEFKKGLISLLQDIEEVANRMNAREVFVSNEEKAKKIIGSISDLREAINWSDSLGYLLASIRHQETEIQNKEVFVSNEEEVKEIIYLISEVRHADNQMKSLGSLLASIKHYEDQIHHKKVFASFDDTVLHISKLIEKYNKNKVRNNALSILLNNIEGLSISIEDEGLKLQLLEKKKSGLEKQLQFCPSCGAAKEHWRK